MKVFVWICEVVLPAVMLAFGLSWRHRPPRTVGSALGYRTRRSMASQAAWRLAHREMARWWTVLGILCLAAVTALVLLLPPQVLVKRAVWGVAGEMLLLVLPVPFVEARLKREFENR